MSVCRDDEGFTLVELIVVVAILGVLAAIGIPSYLAQRDEGYDTQAVADAHQLTVVLEDARTDSGTFPTSLPTYRKSPTTQVAVYHAAGDSYCASVRSEAGHVFRVTSATSQVTEVLAHCSGPTG